ncbi:MAG: glutamate--tRNA ligase [Bacteroidota bacterium]|nr:glutamate--tRNA ligase [Bacteroidota bacterium]
MSTIRTRFAPSPTGFLHVGGLRTALYNYLLAKKESGSFILRIEDTDQSRKVEGAMENLIETLHWAGIEFDEGPGKEGEFGPYIQSQRLTTYQHYAHRLVEEGRAYYCFCTPERLEEVRRKQIAQKINPSYDRRCRSLTKEETVQRRKAGETFVIRMKVPFEGELTFNDIIRGEVTISYGILDDQVILKSDGYPTYHLAVVVDDHLMKISHVIRGEEWLSSTPKHVLLYQYFRWELPRFAHLPLLLNPDKSKLSKRQGDVAVEDYRLKGYLKEALVNFVAFLGWNPGDEREIFSLGELVKDFSLERVGKSGAVFNIEKLDWMNFEHLRRKPDTDVLCMLKEKLASSPFAGKHFTDAYLLSVIGAMRERVTFVRDFLEKSPYFFQAPSDYDADVVKKRWKKESPLHLKQLVEEFSALENPKKEEYEAALHRAAESLRIKNSELIHPLRLAVSGIGAGPGVFDILFILGKEETLRRINSAIKELSAAMALPK